MIRMYDQVPQVYNNASRDFQVLSRLIDIVLNSVKHDIDKIYNLPVDPEDIGLIELLAFTLGFKVKRNYDKEQLAALVSILPTILKYKGSITSIDLVGNAIIKASGAAGIYMSSLKDNVLEIVFPEERVDINLFLDILPYILPAGISVKIIKRTIYQSSIATELGYESKIKAGIFKDYVLAGMHAPSAGEILQEFTTESGQAVNPAMYESYLRGRLTQPDPHAILGVGSHVDSTDPYIPNLGLMDNTIIPVLPPEDAGKGNLVVPEVDMSLLASQENARKKAESTNSKEDTDK